MADDLNRIMNSLGITEDQVSGVFGDLDTDVSGLILSEDDVGAVSKNPPAKPGAFDV